MIAAIFADASAPPVIDFASLLAYGLPGLCLGLVVGIIVFVLSRKVTEAHRKMIQTCFFYACVLFFLVCVVNLATLYINHEAKMWVQVVVEPSGNSGIPDASPEISSTLTAVDKVRQGRVEVSTENASNTIRVSVWKLKDMLDKLSTDNAQKTAQLKIKDEQLVAMEAVNEKRASLFAAQAAVPSDVRNVINEVQASKDVAATTKSVCQENNPTLCGWANLASGDTAAAKQQFQAAEGDQALSAQHAASAKSGLGYVLTTEGNTTEATKMIEQAARQGDVGAVKQLQVIKLPDAATLQRQMVTPQELKGGRP